VVGSDGAGVILPQPGEMHQRKHLPSVTEILTASHLGVELGIPDSKLEYVLRRGTALHSAIELDLAGDLDEDSVVDDIRPRLGAFRKFAAAVNLKPIATEIELTHPGFRFMGHPDLVAWLTLSRRTRRTLLDWKAGWYPFSARFQLAAYDWLWSTTYPDQPIEDHVVVHLKDDGTCTPHHVDLGDGLQVFQAATVVWWARIEREKA